MKNQPFSLFAVLLILLTASCSSNKKEFSTKLSDIVLGDTLLRDEHLLIQIHETCILQPRFSIHSKADIYNQSCAWNQLTFDYETISSNKQVQELFKDDQSRLYLKNFPAPISASSNYYTYLFMEKKGAKKDSILVYKENNFDTPLRTDRKAFLIEKGHLITMEFEDPSSWVWAGIYRKYQIDLKRGKFRKIYNNRFVKKHLEPEPDYKLFNSIDAKYHGKFSVSVETEATTTGMASITYYFSIAPKVIEMETSTYHEPLLCNGKYKTMDKDSLLELYFTGREANCPTKSPLFLLKEENGELFAKGLSESNPGWIKLKRE